MKSARTPGAVLLTLAVIYTVVALLASVDGPLHADRGSGIQPYDAGHGGHLAQTPPTAMITGNMNFCVDMAGALFVGPNYSSVSFDGTGEDVDCAVMQGLYNDTVMLTWYDHASATNGAGNTFTFATVCPSMDLPSSVDLVVQDDGVHNGGQGIQELQMPALAQTAMYTILVPTGATSGPAMAAACGGTFGSRADFANTVNPRPECPVCWSGIVIGETPNAVTGFASTCEMPNMANQITTGGYLTVTMAGAGVGVDAVGICSDVDIPFAANCMVSYTIEWKWGCGTTGGQIDNPNPLQVFSYTWTGTAGNAMSNPVGGINSYVYTRTP